MQQPAPPLLPIFRSPLQAELLSRLLGQPERSYTVRELAAQTGSDTSAVSRELSRLVLAGLANETRVGRTRVVRADQTSPYFPELAGLVIKAFGPARAAADAFCTLPGLSAVVVFGSWAARAAGAPGPAPRDLDVLLVGHPSRVAAHRLADELASRLGLPVQITFATQQEWDDGTVGVITEIRQGPFQEFPTVHAAG